MLNPNQLSNEALAVLRAFAQSGSQKAGSALTLATIEGSWKQSNGDLEVGLSDLETASLLVRNDSDEPSAVITEEGAAFFRRYYKSCY